MAKKRISIKMISYGEYEKWDRSNKKLPVLKHISNAIKGYLDTEFGYILDIKGAKGKTIEFTIEHPPFKNKFGDIDPPFTGSFFIDSNDYQFYLGDCIWNPIQDKLGDWTMISMIDNNIIAKKTIKIINPDEEEFNLIDELEW